MGRDNINNQWHQQVMQTKFNNNKKNFKSRKRYKFKRKEITKEIKKK
jgi:hypothetical protein